MDTIIMRGKPVADKYRQLVSEKLQAAKENGLPDSRIHHFLNKDKLHELLAKLVKRGDTILVKGASKTNMFETVQYLDKRYKGK